MEFQPVCQVRSATKTFEHDRAPIPRGGVCGACRAGSEDLVRCDFGAAHEETETRHFYTFLAVLSFYIIWLGFSGRFLVPETLLGCKNLGIILPLKSWTLCGIAIFWTCATTPTSSNSWGQKLGMCHVEMRKQTIWHSIWVVFPTFSQFYHSLYIYISSFVFHLLIIFLSFLSVRPLYSSELCLECMLLLSCLEGFTMLVVVVSFFSSI